MSESQPIELDAGTPEIDLAEVKKRSITGILALTSRTFVIQIISFIATLLLTILLAPEIYGIFFLVSSVVNFLTYFSDVGLAAALIQKKSKLTRQDLVTTFTIQQVLVITLLIILFSATPYIRNFYGMNSAGIYLMWAFGISLFLSSLKTIPSVLLEREIQFNKLIIPQIAETLVFNFVAVYFAWKGFGITAFTLAVLLRGITGLILMYIVSPWLPGIGVNRKSLSHLLKFGLPYQANTLLAVIKDDGMTIILGKIIGTTGLGYIGWASKWANMPLRIFMDNITKVAFPAFARLQDDKQKLGKAVEKSIFFLGLAIFPILIAMGLLAHPLVNLIPRYQKWLPALIPLYLYLFNAAWASVSTPLTNALNAIGKIKTTFKLMIMWTVLTWALMPALAIKFGFVGVSLAAAIIAVSSVIVIIVIKKHVPFSIIKALKTPMIASAVLALYLSLSTQFITNYLSISLISTGGIIIYAVSVILIEGKDFIPTTLSYFKQSKS